MGAIFNWGVPLCLLNRCQSHLVIVEFKFWIELGLGAYHKSILAL